MMLVNKIAKEITDHATVNTKCIVAICGAADLGKSFFSKQLVNCLRSDNVTADILPLDSYLLSRTDRAKRQLSGYQPEAYNLKEARKTIIFFQNGKSITYYPYCHAIGKQEKKKKTINPSKFLIIEGLHSMHQSLIDLIDSSIFIFTQDEYLRKIRLEADQSKRKQTTEFSAELEPIEFKKYKDFVEPYKYLCDLQLFLEEKWSYKIEKTT